MTEIFELSDYKDILRDRIDSAPSNWGLIRQMAEAAGCQRSYLSQVLSTHVHLTKDQAYGIAQFWKLNAHETEYFLTLVERARCSSPTYQTHLDKKIRALQLDNKNIARKVEHARPMQTELETLYYSAWYWAAIHMMVSVPEFQTASAISQRLQLPTLLVQNCLETLEKNGMVKKLAGKTAAKSSEKSAQRWTFAGSSIHLPQTSPLISVLHQNWRGRALLDTQLRLEDTIHYSSLHSLSHKAYLEIKTLIMRLIEESHEIAGPSDSEEVACVNIDLFKV